MDLGVFQPFVSDSVTGDRLLLDSELLQGLKDEILPETPLILELVVDGSVSYGIGWEFTASKGQIGLSAEKFGQFSNHAIDKIRLRRVVLEKGTFAKLTFISNTEYSMDYRALLEATLRLNHATLVKNETLTITLENSRSNSKKEIKFLISDLKPKDAILCINTDLEVDIVSPVGVGLDRVKSHSRVVLDWKNDVASISKLKLENSLYLEAQIEETRPFMKLILKLKDGEDLNVFVSTLYEYPDLMHHEYFSVEYGSSSMEFKVENTSSKILYIGIIGNTENTGFDLKLIRSDSTFQSQADVLESSSSRILEGSVQCKNCRSWIPQTTIMMHSAFCERNNRLCKKCLQVFKIPEFNNHWHCEMDDCLYRGHILGKEKHHKNNHIPVCCDCESLYFLSDLANHRRNDCPERMIICRFCHLMVRAGPKSILAKDLYLGTGLTEHESVCGSRTITCIHCQKQVQLKDIQIHSTLHSSTEKLASSQLICSNINCSNSLNAEHKNAFDLCRLCIGFISENNDIPQQIIKTYHSQLTQGCGSLVCRNKKCSTGLSNTLNQLEKMNSTDAAVEAIRLYKKSVGPDKSFYFCMENNKDKQVE